MIQLTRPFQLEELDEVFEAANPVKASLANRAAMVNNEGHVIAGSDA